MSEQRKIDMPKGFGDEAERFFKRHFFQKDESGVRYQKRESGELVPDVMVGDRLSGVDGAKHQLRALSALAEHVCLTRLTDGFCRSENRPECRCWQEADGLLKAMSSRGVYPVWFYQKDTDSEGPDSRPDGGPA